MDTDYTELINRVSHTLLCGVCISARFRRFPQGTKSHLCRLISSKLPVHSDEYRRDPPPPTHLRLSVFIGFFFFPLLRLQAFTGSHIHPRSCPRDAAEAFRRSRSKAYLTGSFWWGRSREMLLFRDGNASTNSKKKHKCHIQMESGQKVSVCKNCCH